MNIEAAREVLNTIKEYNKIMNEVTTYCDEMVAKFIIGDEQIENGIRFTPMKSLIKKK